MEETVERDVARSVVGVVDDAEGVQRVLAQLSELGITSEQISVMMRDGGMGEIETSTQQSRVTAGAATGAAFGGLLGGLAGWMIAIGALAVPGVVVPGVGLVFGAGTLASLLTGLAVGAAAGGIVGALLGLGVPEEEAREYERHVARGRALITVHTPSSEDPLRVAQILQANGAYDVRLYETPREPEPALQPVADVAETMPQTEAVETSAISQIGDEQQEPLTFVEHPVADEVTVQEVGEPSAETDSLGSGAEGGIGSGEARGAAPEPLGASATSPGIESEVPGSARTEEGPERVENNSDSGLSAGESRGQGDEEGSGG